MSNFFKKKFFQKRQLYVSLETTSPHPPTPHPLETSKYFSIFLAKIPLHLSCACTAAIKIVTIK